MPPESGLPRRQSGGYRVTSIILEVMAGKQLAERIAREVTLPEPPSANIDEMQLAELLTRLTPLAAKALEILQRSESMAARAQHNQQQYERVQIRVLSGGRLIGRINGARQTFNPRGQMTSAGVLTNVDTRPRPRKRTDGGDGK